MTTRTPQDYALTDDQANAIALAAFEKHCGRPHPWEGAQPWVIAAIKAAGAPQSGWISVDERLPPKDVEVLVYTPASVQKVCLDEWGTYYECPVSFSTATIPTGDGWLGHEFEEVTHWKEIPLPPSTKGEPHA